MKLENSKSKSRNEISVVRDQQQKSGNLRVSLPFLNQLKETVIYDGSIQSSDLGATELI